MLQKFATQYVTPVNTPVVTGMKFINSTEDHDSIDQQLHWSVISNLVYFLVATRLEITYTMKNVVKFVPNHPINIAWIAVIHVIQHLKGTCMMNLGLLTAKTD